MRSSLSRNFLWGVGATTLAFTVLATLSAFVVFQKELAHRQISFLAGYVQERTDNLDSRFNGLKTLQASAVSLLQRRAARLGDAEAQALLDRDLPLRPDGTRRTRPEAFDGMIGADGELTYGMGAFLADGAHIAPQEQRVLAAAYGIVAGFGQAAHGAYDNFYFYTPHNRVVMFGPDRPDHLIFYRERAPANLDFSHEEFEHLVTPQADPSEATRCTSLQRLIQEHRTGARTTTACISPVYVDGRYQGAFGTSIDLTAFFADVERLNLGDASSLVVRGDGVLVAYPKREFPNGASEAQAADYEKTHGLSELVAKIRRQGKNYGVLASPDGKDLIAFGRLRGPDWYYLLSYPAAQVTWSAARSAAVILLAGLAAALLQALVIMRLARQQIVQPLHDLAASCSTRGSPLAQAQEARDDEIGVLARALRDERDRSDAVLASLEERVAERTTELEKANEEKSRFLANMSHELRTPLNGVIAVSETLAREQTTPRNQELAELILASGRLLEQVLSDILDFSKIEAGEMRIEQHPFELHTTVARVAELHRASAEAKGIALAWDIAPEAQGAFLGDGVRLTQVLSNLLSNAVKFTSQGGVGLRVRAEDDHMVFEVSDTGVGFDEEARKRLFHRFQQADVSIRRRFGGTGLGLAICRSLVRLMGGEINAVSVPNKGATFFFHLPLRRVAQSTGPVAPVKATGVDLSGLQVLLAEDHPTNQRVVRLILEAVGVDLTVVENGALALDAFSQCRFDLVLMDMQMPEMDGLTATAQLRAREAARGAGRTPVIMLTANAMEEHVQASLTAGADRHLSKPLRPVELLGAIADLVGAGDPEVADSRAA